MKLPRMLACAFCFAALSVLAEESTVIKPLRDFGGAFQDDKDLPLKKAAPAHGVIAEEKAYLKLWETWNKDVKPPKVDFATELVLVGTVDCAANKLGGNFKLSEAGDLKAVYAATLVAGPGFVWRMFVVPREGIKTVNGKPLEEKPEKDEK